MSSNLAEYNCLVPASVEEALRQRAEHPGIMPIAGGTEVMVWLNDGNAPKRPYQSLHKLAKEWRYVGAAEDGGLLIGAMANYTDIRHHPHVTKHYPLLVEAARVTGALQIQNRATIVGNIANGSPAADTVPSLMVYDAELRLVSLKGERRVALAQFFTGYRSNILQPDELIAEIILPPPAFSAPEQHYRKVGTREAQAISKVVFAGGRSHEKVRMALGSLGPTTIRPLKTEEAILRGAGFDEAWAILQTEISPIDDIRSTREYRLKVTRNILREFLEKTAHVHGDH